MSFDGGPVFGFGLRPGRFSGRIPHAQLIQMAEQKYVYRGRVVRIDGDRVLVGINAERLGKLTGFLPGITARDLSIGQPLAVQISKAFRDRQNQPCFNLTMVEEFAEDSLLRQKRDEYEGKTIIGVVSHMLADRDRLERTSFFTSRRDTQAMVSFGEPNPGLTIGPIPSSLAGCHVLVRVERVFFSGEKIKYDLTFIKKIDRPASFSDLADFYVWPNAGLEHSGLCPKSLVDAWKKSYNNVKVTNIEPDVTVYHNPIENKFTPYTLVLPKELEVRLSSLWPELHKTNQVELTIVRCLSSGHFAQYAVALPEFPTIPIGHITTPVKSIADKIGQKVLLRLNDTTLASREKFYFEAATGQALFVLVNEDEMRGEELAPMHKEIVRFLTLAQKQTVQVFLRNKVRTLGDRAPDYYDQSLIVGHGPFAEWTVCLLGENGQPVSQEAIGMALLPVDWPETERVHQCVLSDRDYFILGLSLDDADKGTLRFVSSYLTE